jgi:hypothetical protein
VTFSNIGGQPLTIQAVHLPGAPFTSTGAPAAGDTIQPGAGITVDISFDPTAVGSFTDAVGLDDSGGGSAKVGLSASAATPGQLRFSTATVDFGEVQLGATATRTFTISNVGGTAVTITRSKPPFGGAFAATTTLPEGATIDPGKTLSESVTFAPTSSGLASGSWQVNSDDGSGAHQVQLTGTGIEPAGGSTGGTTPGASGATTTPIGARPTAAPPSAPRFVPALATSSRLGGVYITYTAKVAGLSRFVLERATTGRHGARGCIAATAQNRLRARCVRYELVAVFIHRDHLGENKLRLLAYVAVRHLPPGSYRLQSSLLVTPTIKDTFLTTLRVVAPQAPHRAGRTQPIGALLGGLLRGLAAVLMEPATV